jgi:hypothetical protein
LRDLFHVQDADQRVDTAVEHWNARVAALAHLRQHFVPFVADVDAADLVARHHDVFDADLLQVEDAHQHALVAMRDHRAGLGHDGAQFFGTQRSAAGLVASDAKQAQHAVRDEVGQPHDGIDDLEQHGVDNRGGQRNPLGIQRAERLGRHLAEDDQYGGEESDADGCVRLAAEREGDHRHQGRRGGVHEVVADQDHPDQPVWPLQQISRWLVRPCCPRGPGAAGDSD